MFSKKTAAERLKRITKWAVYGVPYMLMAGLMDYRFHRFYYPKLDTLRPTSGIGMFDFVSIFDLYVVLIAVTYIVSRVVSSDLRGDFKRVFVEKKIRFFIGTVSLGLVTAFLSYSPTTPIIHGLNNYIFEMYGIPLMTFYLCVAVLDNAHSTKIFIHHTIVALAGMCFLTLVEFFTGLLPGVSKDFLGRAVWPYIDPFVAKKPESANWLSYLAAPTALLSIGLYTAKSSRLTKFICAMGLIMGVGVLLASKSYTGIASFGVVTTIYFWKKISAKKLKRVVVVASLCIALIFIYSQKDSQKFQILMGNYNKENSLQRRIQIYDVTLHMLAQQPLTGVGPGNYQSMFIAQMPNVLEKEIPADEVPPHPHNFVINWWSDLGIFGLIAMVMLYGDAIYCYCLTALTNIGLLPLGYLLFHGLLDVPYGLEETSTLFWIILSLVVINNQHKTPSELTRDTKS